MVDSPPSARPGRQCGSEAVGQWFEPQRRKERNDVLPGLSRFASVASRVRHVAATCSRWIEELDFDYVALIAVLAVPIFAI